MARKQPTRETQAAPQIVVPAEDRIRERAYEIWARNGYPEGTHVEDWLEAERQLAAEGATSTAGVAA